MMKVLFKICVSVCICTALLLGGCEKSEKTAKEKYIMGKTPEELYGYSYIVDSAEYAYAFAANDSAHKILVNKQNPLESSYAPSDLTKIPTSLTNNGKEVEMESIAADAAIALITEMRARGYTGVSITSGYRSYTYQNYLFNKYIEDEMKSNSSLTKANAEEKVLTYSAKPGTSEHQTGLCMDLFYNGMTELVNYGYETEKDKNDVGFAETGAYRWLCENAKYFGFILRFPKDKDSITGYSYESWHFRFVGVDTAISITDAGLTLEEYLNK